MNINSLYIVPHALTFNLGIWKFNMEKRKVYLSLVYRLVFYGQQDLDVYFYKQPKVICSSILIIELCLCIAERWEIQIICLSIDLNCHHNIKEYMLYLRELSKGRRCRYFKGTMAIYARHWFLSFSKWFFEKFKS